MIHSPNGFNFDGLDGPDDLRRRFVAVRRSMNAEVRSLDAMVNFHNTYLLQTNKMKRKRRGSQVAQEKRSPNYSKWLNKNQK
jgi:hypothetical protein